MTLLDRAEMAALLQSVMSTPNGRLYQTAIIFCHFEGRGIHVLHLFDVHIVLFGKVSLLPKAPIASLSSLCCLSSSLALAVRSFKAFTSVRST